MKKIAIIGAGRWGRNIIKTVSEISPLTEIGMVIYTGNKETENFLNLNYPLVPISTNLQVVLDDISITHVIIATPIDTHFSITKQCLEAKKHTFVEKPLSCNPEDARTLHAFARKHDLLLQTGYVYLFDKSLQVLTEKTANLDTLELHLVWKKYGTFDSSIVTNLLVHELAIAHTLLGAFSSIESLNVTNNTLNAVMQYRKGRVTITIDRESTEREKTLRLVSGSDEYYLKNGILRKGEFVVHEEDVTKNLRKELTSFFQGERQENWEEIDIEIGLIIALATADS